MINFFYCISGWPAWKRAFTKFFLSSVHTKRFPSKHSDGRDPPGSPNRRAAVSRKESTAQWLARQTHRLAASIQHTTTILTWPTAGCDVIKTPSFSPVGEDRKPDIIFYLTAGTSRGSQCVLVVNKNPAPPSVGCRNHKANYPRVEALMLVIFQNSWQ